MTSPITAYDLGRIPYRTSLEFQRRAVSARAAGARGDAIYFAEHEPVLTVGRGGTAESLRASEALLRARRVEVVPVERGGDITYHGPGQIIAYPIVALSDLPSGRDLHRYLRDLEEVLITALAAYGLRAERRPPYTGVWIGERKVAAIGVAVRRWITFHGFALNVDPDLGHFDWIHPCGIRHLGVTSMRSLLGEAPPRAHVLARLRESFAGIWNRPVVERPWQADGAESLPRETLHA
ncbi:MAG TPA: lipoyl(octanoyl) transferase LipB [Candidatus Eisenbacteria bacterium]